MYNITHFLRNNGIAGRPMYVRYWTWMGLALEVFIVVMTFIIGAMGAYLWSIV